MSDKKMPVFRFLTVAFMMVLVAGIVGPDTEGSIAVVDALEGMDEDTAAISGLIVLVALPALCVSSLGLLMLKSWARWVYLASTAVLVAVLLPVIGLRLTFLDGSLGTLETVLTGSILYMSLVSHADSFD